MKKNDLLLRALETISNFVVVDQNGIITYMNQIYADMLGKPLSDVIGYAVTDVIPGTRLPEVLASGQSETGQVMSFYDHRTKRQIQLVCNRLPIYDGDTLIGAAAMTLLEDMDEIDRLYKELDETRAENLVIRRQLDAMKKEPLSRIIGNTAQIEALKKTISEFAASKLTLLFTGETGVGKEVFANAVHHLSPRHAQPFVRVNCAAIPADLLESELFGYVEGAFTGAAKGGKPGRFELADGGTLLLDEIGELPPALQAKLLRVLQEGEVDRVGSSRPTPVDVRVLCATNVNLRDKMRKGQFREDLYYRINTVELVIPPLRERIGDLPLLCYFFVRRNNEENTLHTKGLTKDVLHLLEQYSWPGNVRELQHVIERLCFLHPDSMITLENCDFIRRKIASEGGEPVSVSSEAPSQQPSGDVFHTARIAAEKDTIRRALYQAGGNRTKAAALLGISRSMLYVKMKKYGI